MSRRRINLSRLPPEKRKPGWDWLQKNYPEQAEFLAREDVKSIVKAFEAEVIFEYEPTDAD